MLQQHNNIHYEPVIGLEVHIQLNTLTKLFSSDKALFSTIPNQHISAITIAHPGTLPVVNKKAITLAIQLGILCHCDIQEKSYFERKHYFYPDLPKGYQITQNKYPICIGGYIQVPHPIFIHHIHIEEDAGKSIHQQTKSYIDYNRAGTPLLELVTMPCIHSAEDAALFLTQLRKWVRWTNISDGNMEEGSIRCDVNISIRKQGDTTLGTKVEIKNINSIKFVKKAIEVETQRLIKCLEQQEKIIQETRSFHPHTLTTSAMREKEQAHDYRYLLDPDLPPILVTKEMIENAKSMLPILPEEKQKQFIEKYHLSPYDATQLTEDIAVCKFFEQITHYNQQYKSIANWIQGPIKQILNEQQISIQQLPFNIQQLSSIINMVEMKQISFSQAATQLLPKLTHTQIDPIILAKELNILLSSESAEIDTWIDMVLLQMPDKVKEYKQGKKGLLGLFVGAVKKMSHGKADPSIVTKLLEEKLLK